DRLYLLKQLITRSRAEVVLSSAWRCDEALFEWATQELAAFQIRIYSTTPCSGWRSRVDEICAWLKDHERQVDAFAVLDDSDLSGGGLLEGHVVYTDPAVGLTADKVAAALAPWRAGSPSATGLPGQSSPAGRSRPPRGSQMAAVPAVGWACGRGRKEDIIDTTRP
ncbi:tycC, partial [Symbiodinium sp. CCMP2456]